MSDIIYKLDLLITEGIILGYDDYQLSVVEVNAYNAGKLEAYREIRKMLITANTADKKG